MESWTYNYATRVTTIDAKTTTAISITSASHVGSPPVFSTITLSFTHNDVLTFMKLNKYEAQDLRDQLIRELKDT